MVDLGGELNLVPLGPVQPPGRWLIVPPGLVSVGEELQRLLDESLRGRLVSSRSLRVRM